LIGFLLVVLFGNNQTQHKSISLFDANKAILNIEEEERSYDVIPVVSSNNFDGTNTGIRSNSNLVKTVTQENFLNKYHFFTEYSFQSIQKAFFKSYSDNYFYHFKRAKYYLRWCSLLI
jgi:hypothetical protein